ncbi:hypothetical protein H257_03163 [Aphanomyces astaci]|uniref:Uncharacterized protein n=1 Tax=Aphanomyces astaci TaxID=112090 RepID=W4H2E3_APHAT|nr:hypothetical protein H257_03163 [Aphanomyces astaci]ETV85424.1 hypothetical protein H257_03163 [Aphanomyces astaci]|eukprot:XP_009825442.1 hypothetical protein H257_03163 [Aphanomyces astaci]
MVNNAAQQFKRNQAAIGDQATLFGCLAFDETNYGVVPVRRDSAGSIFGVVDFGRNEVGIGITPSSVHHLESKLNDVEACLLEYGLDIQNFAPNKSTFNDPDDIAAFLCLLVDEAHSMVGQINTKVNDRLKLIERKKLSEADTMKRNMHTPAVCLDHIAETVAWLRDGDEAIICDDAVKSTMSGVVESFRTVFINLSLLCAADEFCAFVSIAIETLKTTSLTWNEERLNPVAMVVAHLNARGKKLKMLSSTKMAWLTLFYFDDALHTYLDTGVDFYRHVFVPERNPSMPHIRYGRVHEYRGCYIHLQSHTGTRRQGKGTYKDCIIALKKLIAIQESDILTPNGKKRVYDDIHYAKSIKEMAKWNKPGQNKKLSHSNPHDKKNRLSEDIIANDKPTAFWMSRIPPVATVIVATMVFPGTPGPFQVYPGAETGSDRRYRFWPGES